LLSEPEAAVPEEANMAADATGNNTEVPHIFKAVASVIENELVKGEHQLFTAFIALLGGLGFVIYGKELFDLLICVLVGYVLGVLVMGSVGDLWSLDHDSSLRKLVGWEAGIIGCVGAYKGKDGMNIFAGVTLGFWFTYYIQHVLVHLGCHFLSTDDEVVWHHWAVVIFYTVFAGGFLWMFNGEGHVKLLALITPFIGGILTASAIAFFFTSFAMWGPVSKPLLKKCPDLHPVGGAWVKFLVMLSSPETKDFGIFAGSPLNTFGEKWTIDRLAGYFLWFIFWVVGVIVQWKKAKTEKPPPASMRELWLQQPLMEPAVE